MMAWAAIASGAVILALGIAVKVQSARLDACKAEFAGFVAQVEANGKAAEAAAKKQAADDKSRKEKADAENAKVRRDMAGVYDAYKRLRDARAASGYVPPAAPGSSRPDVACFKRDEFNRTMGTLDAGGAGLAKEGDDYRIDLDTAKAWAGTAPATR